MRIIEKIEAWGHPNITAKNRTTFEVTKEKHLTRKGDCVIAVNASKGAQDLNDEFKQAARRNDAFISLIAKAGQFTETVKGRGDLQLTFSHTKDLVGRRSSYVCARTLMVYADKAAANFSRNFIKELQNPSQKVVFTLIIHI